MHLYVAMRGNKMWVDALITELQGKYLPFPAKVKDGKLDGKGEPTTLQFQLGVRPIQLYEFAFPKESKDIILTTLFGKEGKAMRDEYAHFEKYLKFIRAGLGLKKIDDNWNHTNMLPVTNANVDIIGIGIKDDKEFEWGEGL